MPHDFHLVSPFVLEKPEIWLSLLIGFILIALLIVRVPIPFLSVPHYRAILVERSARIETNKNQVDTALAEVEHVRSDYAARLARIEEEARQRIDAAVKESDAARAEIIADAEQLAQAIRRRGEDEIARERTRQRILFRQQLVQTTLDAAEDAIHAHSSVDVQHQLISDFITRAGSAPAQSSGGQA